MLHVAEGLSSLESASSENIDVAKFPVNKAFLVYNRTKKLSIGEDFNV